MTRLVNKPERPIRVFLRRLNRYGSWLLLLILVVVLTRRLVPTVESEAPRPDAPDFEAVDLKGGAVRLSALRGQVVVVNFWATWCPPCLAEIPGFVRLQRELGPRGVRFIGIALDDEGAAVVEPFTRKRNMNYPVVVDHGHIASLFGGAGTIPTTILIDRSGRIASRHEGLLPAVFLRGALNELLEEK